MTAPFQQTKAWQKFLQATSETVFFQQTPKFTYLAIKKSTPLGSYLYLPYGPYTPPKTPPKIAYQALKTLARQEKAFFIRVEPTNLTHLKTLKHLRAHKTKDLNPKDTWLLDLTPDTDLLIKNFSQGTRTCYHNIKKRGLSVTTSKNPVDIKHLVNLQRPLAKIKKITPFSADYLKTQLAQDFTTLYLAHYHKNPDYTPDPEPKNGEIIAAAMFFDHHNTRYYMQSASNMHYKQLPATVAILTSAIFDAKSKGLKNFNFWGIAPENAPKNHPWAGFTAFKKSFGGHPVSYCGTWDIILNRPKYFFYSILRAINLRLRKIRASS